MCVLSGIDSLGIIKEKKSLIDQDFSLLLLETLYASRYMDEKMHLLVKQNKGGTFHMNGVGHELVGALLALCLTPKKDWAFPYYRDKSFALGFGVCPIELFGVFMGRRTSHHSCGRMMPEHFSHKKLRIPAQSSVVGSQFLQACGLAKGLALQNKEEVVYVSGGDGATSQGDFHEALNFACLHKLSVIFVIQDNGFAISVPVKDQTAGGTIVKIARGYEGLDVFDVDGCDVLALKEAANQAIEKGRKGLGPSLIVAKVPRLGPHSSSDDPKKYKDQALSESEKERDPLSLYEKFLVEHGYFKRAEIDLVKLSMKKKIDGASDAAELLAFPKKEEAKEHVFKKIEDRVPSIHLKKGESIVMVDALNLALKEEMTKDPSIIVYGQDVAFGKGGVFGVTRSLTDLFGEKRCFNSPLAESTIIGSAIGMSFDGFHKPVVEIQFADYLWTGINQLFNELASIHYRSAGEWNCPVVIRMPTGGYIQGGPYHSQSIEGFLAHCPGLKIVIPSNALDAKLLLKAAIQDPNPVIFLEHKGLYRQRAFSAREEPDEASFDVIGKAKVVRAGSDLTLITWGMTTVMGYEIAEKLFSEMGMDVEVIDLRSIVPLDAQLILDSVKKTSKVLIAHEAPKSCGFGAEVAAMIAEKAFSFLDAPIKRIGSFESSVPYSKVLEDQILLQKKEIEAELIALYRF